MVCWKIFTPITKHRKTTSRLMFRHQSYCTPEGGLVLRKLYIDTEDYRIDAGNFSYRCGYHAYTDKAGAIEAMKHGVGRRVIYPVKLFGITNIGIQDGFNVAVGKRMRIMPKKWKGAI